MNAKLVFHTGSGPDTDVELGDWELTIGREPSCDVVLSDEVVSREQAGIRFEDGLFVIRDLGSTNGTFVNNRKVNEQVLHDGDAIEFGLGGPEARFEQEQDSSVAKTVMVSRDALDKAESEEESEFHCAHCGSSIPISAEILSSETAEYVSIDQSSIPDFCPNCGEQIDKENIEDLLATAPGVNHDLGRTAPARDDWAPPSDESTEAYDPLPADPIPGRPPGTMTALYHEARDIVRAEGGSPTTGMVMKEFVRLTYAKSRRRTWTITIVAFLLMIAVSSFVYFRARAETERVRQESEMALRIAADEISGLSSELATLEESRNTDRQEVADLQSRESELRAQVGRQQAKLKEVGFHSEVATAFGGGVALIHARIRVRHPNGEFLRVGRESDGSPYLTMEKSEPVFEVSGQGTGFLIHKDGWLLTNRHVAVPLPPQVAFLLAEHNAANDLELVPEGEYTIWFPPGDKKYTAMLMSVSRDADVAALRTSEAPSGVPVLPIAKRDFTPDVGRETVLIGYPRASTLLVAYADSEVRDVCLNNSDASTGGTEMLDCLGAEGLVQPWVTQGSVTGIREENIIFQGGTTQGSSGGPLMDAAKRVVGINYSFVKATEDPGQFMSFNAVPIKYAWEILPTEVQAGLIVR